MDSQTTPRRPEGFDGPQPISVGSVVRSELVAEARRLKNKRLRRERLRREYGMILLISGAWVSFLITLCVIYIYL